MSLKVSNKNSFRMATFFGTVFVTYIAKQNYPERNSVSKENLRSTENCKSLAN